MTDIAVTVPTTDEIAARVAQRMAGDLFGFEWHEYAIYLTAEQIAPYLKASAEPWEQHPLSRDEMLKKIKDYMPFAYEKANGQRGISSNRSVMHLIAWTWLAGDREFSAEIQKMFDENYHSYGLPILDRVCEFYNIMH